MLQKKHSLSQIEQPQFICYLCNKSVPKIKQISIENKEPYITFKCPCSVEKKEKLSVFVSGLEQQTKICLIDLPKRKKIAPVFFKNNFTSMFSYAKKLTLKYQEMKSEDIFDDIEKKLPFRTFEEFNNFMEAQLKKNEEYLNTQISTLDFYIKKYENYKELLKEEFNKNKETNKMLISLYSILYSNYIETKTKPNSAILENMETISKFNKKEYSPVTKDVEVNSESLLNYYKSNFILSTSENKNKPFRECSELVKQSTKGIVCSFLLLKDGRCASGLSDKTIQIFNLISKKSQFTLEGHTDTVSSLAQLKEDHLISGSYDFTIKIWDIKNNYTCLQTLVQDNCKINSILGDSTNESNIIVAGNDGTVSVWDVNTHKRILNQKKSENPISLIIPLQSNDKVAAVSNSSIYILKKPDMYLVATMLNHKSRIGSIVQLKDGRIVSVSIDSMINVWSDENYQLIRSIRANNVNSLIQLNDGRVISSSSENCLDVWDFESYQVVTSVIPETLQCVKVQLKDGRIVSVVTKGKYLTIH